MVFETILQSDLQKMVNVKQLTGNLFSADNGGNKITVEILDGGAPATVSGSVYGYAIREDEKTVVIEGTLSGNKASIVLPASAYAVIGKLNIVIKVGTATVGACSAYVYRTTTDAIVDPGSVVPDISELLAQIGACEEATTAANTAATAANTAAANVGGNLAANYSASAAYAVGDYCIKDGTLYRCTTAITSGENWNSSHWTAAKIGPDVSALKSALGNVPSGKTAQGQIIELQNKVGNVSLPTTSQTLTGAIAEHETDITVLRSHKVNQPLDEYNQPTYGTNGQSLRTKGNGETEWADVGLPTDEQTGEAISAWLERHPDATTTVQDGSLTKNKFTETLKLETLKDYVTPQMFGAKADGDTNPDADDTIALQEAINSGKPVIVPNGVYIIKSPLYADDRLSITLQNKAEIRVGGSSTIEFLIGLKNNGQQHTNTYGDVIKGGTLNGNHKCNVIIGLNYVVQGVVESVNVKNFNSCGIYVRHNTINAGIGSGSCIISGCRIENDTPKANTYGIIDRGGDNIFEKIVVKDAQVGIIVNGGSTASECHVWQSDDYIFDDSVAFLLRGQLGLVIGCISDTMRYGIVTDSNYVKYNVSDFTYYFNSNVTPKSFLDEHTPCVFNFYSDRQYFCITNTNLHLENSIAKVISDNAIDNGFVKFIGLNMNGMDNAIRENIPYDRSTIPDLSMFIPEIIISGNITNERMDQQLTTGVFGGYVAEYAAWGIVITVASYANTVVQSIILAGIGIKTRRYANGAWNSFS